MISSFHEGSIVGGGETLHPKPKDKSGVVAIRKTSIFNETIDKETLVGEIDKGKPLTVHNLNRGAKTECIFSELAENQLFSCATEALYYIELVIRNRFRSSVKHMLPTKDVGSEEGEIIPITFWYNSHLKIWVIDNHNYDYIFKEGYKIILEKTAHPYSGRDRLILAN